MPDDPHPETTPRPWFVEDHSAMDATRSRIILFVGDSDQDRADLALVVDSVNEVEALRAERDALELERDELLAGAEEAIAALNDSLRARAVLAAASPEETSDTVER